jgi:hypothetical protein
VRCECMTMRSGENGCGATGNLAAYWELQTPCRGSASAAVSRGRPVGSFPSGKHKNGATPMDEGKCSGNRDGRHNWVVDYWVETSTSRNENLVGGGANRQGCERRDALLGLVS